MPAAVSEQDFTGARFTHAHCGFTQAANNRRLSLPQTILQMLEMVLDLNKRWEWMERARLLLMYDHVPLCPQCLLYFSHASLFQQSCLLSASKVLQAFVLQCHRDYKKKQIYRKSEICLNRHILWMKLP